MSLIRAAGPSARQFALPAAHTAPTLSPRAALLLGAAFAVVLCWLWAKARYQRRRLSRAFTRSLSYGTSRKQLKSLRKRRVLGRSSRARRAAFRFRLAVLLSVLILAAWAYSALHIHAR